MPDSTQFPPKEISKEENIARVVFSPSMVEDGHVSPTAFVLRELRKPEDYVSVFRLRYFVPTKENITMIRPPQHNTIYGYAMLNVGICRQISYNDIMVDVLSHASEHNPSHAGIHYTKSGTAIKGVCVEPDFLIVTRMLANNATLQRF